MTRLPRLTQGADPAMAPGFVYLTDQRTCA
jgi:hypothetical protein